MVALKTGSVAEGTEVLLGFVLQVEIEAALGLSLLELEGQKVSVCLILLELERGPVQVFAYL